MCGFNLVYKYKLGHLDLGMHFDVENTYLHALVFEKKTKFGRN